MKGFELCFNGVAMKMAVEDGIVVVFIHVFNSNKDKRIAVSGFDHYLNKKISWYDTELKLGDEICVKFTDIDDCSKPIQVSDIKSRNELRIEQYNSLKESLIKRGVL